MIEETRPCAQKRTPWWELPSALALDVACVALVWQALFARVLGVKTYPYHRVLLAMAVLLVYGLDRWGDAHSPSCKGLPTFRHRFPRMVPNGMRVGLILLPCALLLAIVRWANEREMIVLFSLSLPIGLHLRLAGAMRSRWPKQASTALLFTLGAASFPLSAAAASFHALPDLGWFFLLGLTNLHLISRWEREDTGSAASRAPWLLLAASTLASALAYGPVPQAVALSSLLLGLLDGLVPRIGPARARALADLALLGPLPFLGFG